MGDLRRMKNSSKPDSPLLFPDLAGRNWWRDGRPNSRIEHFFGDKGYIRIAGIDEVGRGPLAGPVVAACVSFDGQPVPPGINDSKKLSAKTREELFDHILASASVSIAIVSAKTVDAINIRQATLLAMKDAMDAHQFPPDLVLIDGRDRPDNINCDVATIIKGDSKSLSIAAASIVAKVVRDRQMVELARLYPEYGFENHKGYGSRFHLEAIATHGPCPQHRMSFSPMRNMQ